MAERIRSELSVEPTLVEGDNGEFTVWVGDQMVAKKGLIRFPADADVVKAVAKALEASR